MRRLAEGGLSTLLKGFISVGAFLFLVSPVALRGRRHSDGLSTFGITVHRHPLPKSRTANDFWASIHQGLLRGQPSFPSIPKLSSNGAPYITFDRQDYHSKWERFENLNLTEDQISELAAIRRKAVSQAAILSSSVPFIPGTRGIVTTAPANAFAILTTSLWMIRASGSTLPIEVWIWDQSEWEEEMCGDIVPKLGGTCMVMTEHLPLDVPLPFETAGRGQPFVVAIGETFKFKALAMLLSTFEQVLFLDDDSFPVMNPDSLFETEPFTSIGYILWPDLWAKTASKYWYEISKTPMPDIKDRASTESGQMIINKATHASALVLAYFYIYYGKHYWYHLLSQGAPGHGDKEVWQAAAIDLDLKWYQVNERPRRVGYICSKDRSMPVGTAHSHPLDDYKYTRNGIVRHVGGHDYGFATDPRILFVHQNMPKAEALNLLESATPGYTWHDILRCEGSSKDHRMWGPKELALKTYGWDPEKALWSGIRWAACQYEQGFSAWTAVTEYRPAEKIRHDLCEKVTKHWEELFTGDVWSASLPKWGGRKERPWGGLFWQD